jgi:beta-lactamase superfamily II metal-dependent hydrolase
MHSQARATYRGNNVPWFRTDENGTIVITSPGSEGEHYTVSVQRGKANAVGRSDKRSAQSICSTGGKR